MLAIDEQMSAALQMPAEDGELRDRFLGDNPQLKRQRAEDDRRVVMALVIGHKDMRRARRQPIETFNINANAGRLQNQP